MKLRNFIVGRSFGITILAILLLSAAIVFGCATPGRMANASAGDPPASSNSGISNAAAPKGASIPIEPNGPADTVRAFYRLLREKKFREAIFLTNLRPAIEGLTETELSEFALDFEAIAGQVPAEIEINGEIVSGDQATVTANLPNADGDKNELQTIKLKKEGSVWVIQTADEESAKRIKQEGKNYFYNLRIETHQEEAKKMLERISKAELAHSLQNGGLFADMSVLIEAGLLPPDAASSDSTGYRYSIDLASDKKRYSASAIPAVYGKSGKLSFLLQIDGKGISRVTSKDNNGKALAK